MSSHTTSRLWITTARGGYPALASRCPIPAPPLRGSPGRGIVALFILSALALPAFAQYQGQINTTRNQPELRAVGVFEWTGDQDHPKTSRLIPICIFDGQDLQDASVYMSQPEPLALQSEVEYQLMHDGKPIGLFDISSAAEQQGSWIGLGSWRPLAKPKPAQTQIARIDEDNGAQSDEPVLHRGGDAARGNSGGSGNGSGANAPPPDPDRPTLHRSGDASGSGSSGSSSSGTDANAPPPDPDRPILKPEPDTSSASTPPAGSDRPKLKQMSDADESYGENVSTAIDPNRPRLFYGKASGYGAPLLPGLIGMPPDMHQEVAVSDVTNRPIHVWDYSWANPADEARMKADMEDLARTALGLNPPPAPAARPSSKRAASSKTTRLTLPPPAPLLDEQFRVFELAYGSGATMVLSAHSSGSGEQEKFVTLVAQPDLYGNVAILLKNVTDAAHLDDMPRMKLIDAVDARADNRGELLFELRGATQRQFALYRVLRGDATRIFLSSIQPIALAAANPAN